MGSTPIRGTKKKSDKKSLDSEKELDIIRLLSKKRCLRRLVAGRNPLKVKTGVRLSSEVLCASPIRFAESGCEPEGRNAMRVQIPSHTL